MKGPDFVSRLNGYLNVAGPNPRQKYDVDRRQWVDDDDPRDLCFPVRRALLMRATGGFFGAAEGDEMDIDGGLLAAFLEIGKYEHGARSLETIMGLTRGAGLPGLRRSALPPEDQLSLHVDYDEFMELVDRRPAVQDEQRGPCAGGPRASTASCAAKEGWPILYDVDFAAAARRREGRQHRRRGAHPAGAGLRGAGRRERRTTRRPCRGRRCWTSSRPTWSFWPNASTTAGWSRSTATAGRTAWSETTTPRSTPALVQYATLSEDDKEKDRNAVRHYPDIVAAGRLQDRTDRLPHRTTRVATANTPAFRRPAHGTHAPWRTTPSGFQTATRRAAQPARRRNTSLVVASGPVVYSLGWSAGAASASLSAPAITGGAIVSVLFQGDSLTPPTETLVPDLSSPAIGEVQPHTHDGDAARIGMFLSGGFLGRGLSRARRHPFWVLIISMAFEAGFLAAIGAANDPRQILGLPGSLVALTVVIAGALAGPLVGVVTALFAGVVFFATVADFGHHGSLLAAAASAGLWVSAALVSGTLAAGLREQVRRRLEGSVELARSEAARDAQLAEQRRIEQLAADLERQREQLTTIIEHAESSIVFLDRDFNFLLVNSAYAGTCGYSPDEMVGLNHFELYPDEENEAIFRHARETGEAIEFVAKPFVFPDQPERGTTYWDWRLSPIKDESGEVSTFVFSLVEVTEQIRSVLLARALADIDVVVHSALQFDAVIVAALDRAAEALSCDSAAMFERRPSGGWVARYGRGFEGDVAGVEMNRDDERHAILACETGQVVAVDDRHSDDRVDREHLKRSGIEAVLVVPLIRRGDPVGVLFFNYERKHVFMPPEVDFATRLASSLALALDNAQLLKDLQYAAFTLQENLIHPLPQIPGLELGRVSRAAHEPDLVGGDFSDVFPIDEDRVAVLIGDVSGKGIRAAGMTETVHTAVSAYSLIDPSPAAILKRTSELLLRRELSAESFVTAFLLVLDIKTGEAWCASAGHPPAVIIGPSDARCLDVPAGLPLGTIADDYEVAFTALPKGDCVVLYTDGVTEAKRGDELFGETRLLSVASTLFGVDAQSVAERLRDATSDFAGSLRDDLQILALRLMG